jgi:hypothetical protein
VRILRPASEAEAVAAFLRAEIESARWGDDLRGLLREDGAYEAVLVHPDVEDADANAYRARLLDRHRGWLRRIGLFQGLPRDLDWLLVALTPDEVLAIRYIDWDWWLEISEGTRDPSVAAERIRGGLVPGADLDSDRALAERLRSPMPPPELIAIAPPDLSKLVVLEGHVRLTAYALFPELLPDELEVFVGTSAGVDRWSEF